jgi:hypothetical protein
MQKLVSRFLLLAPLAGSDSKQISIRNTEIEFSIWDLGGKSAIC